MVLHLVYPKMAESRVKLPAKRARSAISVTIKKNVCHFKRDNPSCKQSDISSMVEKRYGLSIGRSTISDILKDSAKWLLCEDSKDTKKCQPRHEQLEEALWLWFLNISAQKVAITDEMLKIKAQKFGESLNINGFSYSNGWLHGFKKRHEISLRSIHGEGDSVTPEVVDDGRRFVIEVLLKGGYSLKDIFNMDETGLFYRLQPDKTLATKPVKGTKKSKERITIGLCANADGSEKLKPIVVAKAARPRCFPKTFNVQSLVHYYHNKKSWMTSLIFTDWLKKLDKRMEEQGRQVVLLLDNAPCHVHSIALANVSILYLPPNTTAHLQPMDAGIIRNFKLKYRKSLLLHYVEQIDTAGKFQLVDLKQALYLATDSWNAVTQDTIRNCFRHTQILPDSVPGPSQHWAAVDEPLEDLQKMITRMNPDDPLDARDYVLMPDEDACMEEMTDEDIIQLVSGTNDDVCSEDEDDKVKEPQGGSQSLQTPYTLAEASAVCQRLLLTLESHDSFSEKHYGALREIRRQLAVVKSKEATQTSITHYFHVAK